jgi:hypothetical protein
VPAPAVLSAERRESRLLFLRCTGHGVVLGCRVKIVPAQPDLAELLRRLSAPPVPTQPRGGVAAGLVSKTEPGKAAVLPTPGAVLPTPGAVLPTPGAVLPTPGAALPHLGAALPALPSTPQAPNGFTAAPNGFTAAPKLQLLMDAVAGNGVAQPSLQQDPLSLREQRPETSARQDPGIGRVDHGADGQRPPARAEPQRITEQFWHSEVRPNLEARRELASRLDEQLGVPLQQPQPRTELGMPPGVQLLAALQAGLQMAPGTSAARVATTSPEAFGKSKPKRTLGADVPSLSAERMRRRSYLLAATLAGLIAVLAVAKSCLAF